VVGGGDSAMEEALFLTRFASKVTLLHRREGFRASKIMLERAIAHPKIALRPNTIVEEVLGVEEKEVKGLRLRDVKTGELSELADQRAVPGHRPRAQRKDVCRADRPGRGRLHQDHGQRADHETAWWCRESLPAATCRTGATARRLPRPGRGAWPRWRRRSFSRSRGTEGSCMAGKTSLRG
jgi:hypothetical protein